MTFVLTVDIDPLPPERYASVLNPTQVEALQNALGSAGSVFEGRSVWNVNSNSVGGGVAEMLRSLLAYARGAGVDAKWAVISGNPEFFEVTKRIHNHLHNFAGDGGALGDEERVKYEAALRPNAEEFEAVVGPRDVILLHDPQTAGLIPGLKRVGLPVRPYVAQADADVFSRRSFVWEQLEASKTNLIAPSIDVFSPKNFDLDAATVTAILNASGVVEDGSSTAEPVFTRQHGRPGRVERRDEVFQDASPTAADRLVVQVSRWDSLKDPIGVIDGFARYVAPESDAHLVYAGPAVEAVSDDPEGGEVLRTAIAHWRQLPEAQRRRTHLACLPMADGEENAAMVNASSAGLTSWSRRASPRALASPLLRRCGRADRWLPAGLAASRTRSRTVSPASSSATPPTWRPMAK
jgi:trehalose synthase